MKRYYPTDEERERLHRAERMLGIPSGHGEDPAVSHEPGISRISVAAWRDLWREDPEAWLREIRNRPGRFDREHWRRAVLQWWNQIPARSDGFSGEDPSDDEVPLRGVPVVVKDLYDVTGEETRCGSALFGVGGTDGGPPVAAADRDAWLVGRMRALGATLQGRTAMNEFAYGIDGRNPVTGDCPHPLDSTRISGGSSSGSAWAVAAGVVPLALGTDTGGSIRVPAALCGIYGYRLPWDQQRLPGTFPLSPRMDTVGWFAAGVEDVRLMLNLTGTEASGDSRAAGFSSVEIRIGAVVPPDVSLSSEVRERWSEALALLRQTEGVSLEVIDPPALLGTETWKAYNVIGSSDAAGIHGEWLDRYETLYDPTVWSLIDRGRRWSHERIAAAEGTREHVTRYMERLLATFDTVVMPVTPQASPTFDEADGTFREAVLRLNAPVSLAGLGALAVPLSHDAVRSSGMQLVIPGGREERLSELFTRLGW